MQTGVRTFRSVTIKNILYFFLSSQNQQKLIKKL